MKYKEDYEEKSYSKKKERGNQFKKKDDRFPNECDWEEKQKQKINNRRANKKRDKEKYDKYENWN